MKQLSLQRLCFASFDGGLLPGERKFAAHLLQPPEICRVRCCTVPAMCGQLPLELLGFSSCPINLAVSAIFHGLDMSRQTLPV